MQLFVSPFMPALGFTGTILPGAKLYFYLTGTTTPQAVFDEDGNSLGAEVTADVAGRFVQIYLNDSVEYRVILRDATGITIDEADPIASPFGDLSGPGGAALIGKAGGGTLQDTATFVDNFQVSNLGALPAGTSSGYSYQKTFSGHAGGTTDFRGWVDKITAQGANSIDQVIARNIQLELTHSAGTITRAFGQQAYGRLGLSGSTTGAVTSLRVYDTHIANEGSGTITNAACYFADSVDLGDGTGPITHNIGFNSANMGHATRVTNSAIGFSAGDITGGAALTAGFRSQVSSGTNKFAFYSEGSAPSVFTGSLTLGSSTSPTDRLETYQGYVKFCGSTTKSQAGGCHELRTANSDWTVLCTSTHASTPQGIRIRFAGAAPNNTTQRFLYCDDTGNDRLVIWSNGNVVNANNSYGAISDRKFKTDIRDARPQLEDILKIRFRNYRLKTDDAPEHLGIIAQEAMKVSPGLVSQAGSGKGKHYEVNYSLLYLKAVKALQELAAIVEAQGKEIASLKAAK